MLNQIEKKHLLSNLHAESQEYSGYFENLKRGIKKLTKNLENNKYQNLNEFYLDLDNIRSNFIINNNN